MSKKPKQPNNLMKPDTDHSADKNSAPSYTLKTEYQLSYMAAARQILADLNEAYQNQLQKVHNLRTVAACQLRELLLHPIAGCDTKWVSLLETMANSISVSAACTLINPNLDAGWQSKPSLSCMAVYSVHEDLAKLVKVALLANSLLPVSTPAVGGGDFRYINGFYFNHTTGQLAEASKQPKLPCEEEWLKAEEELIVMRFAQEKAGRLVSLDGEDETLKPCDSQSDEAEMTKEQALGHLEALGQKLHPVWSSDPGDASVEAQDGQVNEGVPARKFRPCMFKGFDKEFTERLKRSELKEVVLREENDLTDLTLFFVENTPTDHIEVKLDVSAGLEKKDGKGIAEPGDFAENINPKLRLQPEDGFATRKVKAALRSVIISRKDSDSILQKAKNFDMTMSELAKNVRTYSLLPDMGLVTALSPVEGDGELMTRMKNALQPYLPSFSALVLYSRLRTAKQLDEWLAETTGESVKASPPVAVPPPDKASFHEEQSKADAAAQTEKAEAALEGRFKNVKHGPLTLDNLLKDNDTDSPAVLQAKAELRAAGNVEFRAAQLKLVRIIVNEGIAACSAPSEESAGDQDPAPYEGKVYAGAEAALSELVLLTHNLLVWAGVRDEEKIQRLMKIARLSPPPKSSSTDGVLDANVLDGVLARRVKLIINNYDPGMANPLTEGILLRAADLDTFLAEAPRAVETEPHRAETCLQPGEDDGWNTLFLKAQLSATDRLPDMSRIKSFLGSARHLDNDLDMLIHWADQGMMGEQWSPSTGAFAFDDSQGLLITRTQRILEWAGFAKQTIRVILASGKMLSPPQGDSCHPSLAAKDSDGVVLRRTKAFINHFDRDVRKPQSEKALQIARFLDTALPVMDPVWICPSAPETENRLKPRTSDWWNVLNAKACLANSIAPRYNSDVDRILENAATLDSLFNEIRTY